MSSLSKSLLNFAVNNQRAPLNLIICQSVLCTAPSFALILLLMFDFKFSPILLCLSVSLWLPVRICLRKDVTSTRCYRDYVKIWPPKALWSHIFMICLYICAQGTHIWIGEETDRVMHIPVDGFMLFFWSVGETTNWAHLLCLNDTQKAFW